MEVKLEPAEGAKDAACQGRRRNRVRQTLHDVLLDECLIWAIHRHHALINYTSLELPTVPYTCSTRTYTLILRESCTRAVFGYSVHTFSINFRLVAVDSTHAYGALPLRVIR